MNVRRRYASESCGDVAGAIEQPAGGHDQTNSLSLRRALILGGVALTTLGLMYRVVDLQLTHRDFLQSQGDARHLRVVAVPAHRGKILDRNGEALAISTPVDSIWANPKELMRQQSKWPELALALGLDKQRMARLVRGRKSREFLYLRRHVAPDLAQKVKGLGITGVYLRREYRRYYPWGEATAHVVGFTDIDDKGREGIELAYEKEVRGVPGAKRVVRDRLGRVVEEVELIQPARDGNALRLSIDARIQYQAYRALLTAIKKHEARAGSAVVLDVVSGEVLAMVNQPSYNPNNGADRVSSRFRNRAVTDVFEPGSTIKPFTVGAALEVGLFRPDSRFDTAPGFMKVGRHTVKDVRNFGEIDLATVIKKSSNVGAVQVALALDARQLWQTFSRVGFGMSTATGFPGESDGVLTHFFQWGDIERTTLSYGYGLSVTALQLAQAYAVIASGGLLPQLSFVHRDEYPARVRVMSADSTRHLRWMLEAVVGPGGTGRLAGVPGYRIGGKTGTVRKAGVGGYSQNRYLSLFAGIAPLTNPRLVSVVVIDEPGGKVYYGGQVAAPVFAEVMAASLRTLGIPPDDSRVVKRRVVLGYALPASSGVTATPPPRNVHANSVSTGAIGEVVR